ncbi:ribonuclease J [Egibacter rhizosphaerae]|uniref:Ribonuclease J n=1 Tax=Egibacter rhizosphaerae TaxID=1670831 RepID=A0A411YJ11_9ACTN|nr:ribonuclease J [Egibacter rhizosphaerae]QBI21268.1 ribonuclease J [Egibacter rhizosphaerae]
MATESPPVTVSFYGGLGEIGANMAAVEVDGKILLIDVGLIFPDAEHFGVDLILPDWSELIKRSDDVHAAVITHGHEDHMGALPFFLRDFPDLPVYGTRLTLGLIEAKLTEHPDVRADLREVEPGDRIDSGPFDLEFVGVSHSIPDGLATAVHTPHGTILHSGDFKLDQTPIDGRTTDIPHLAAIGDEGVSLLLADSTNADSPGFVPSERSVGATMHQVFAQATGRIICTTFASHVHRVQQAIDAATDAGRKVCFVGRSMVRNMPIARELGYLNYDDDQIIDMAAVPERPRDEVAIICTGSQGEPFAALSLMAAGRHKQVQLEVGDTVVMASSVIPGNESAIYKSINGLFRQGAQVVHKGIAPVHVSGHAAGDELKFFHNVVRADGFVPVHGEYRHLVRHAEIARECGTPDDQVFVVSDGERIVLEDGRLRRGEPFRAGRVFVDGLGVGDVGNAVLRHREQLSSEGVCVAVVVVDEQSQIVGEPAVTQTGIIYEPEQSTLLEKASRQVGEELERADHAGDPAQLRRLAVQTLARFWRDEVGRRPVIHAEIVEV